MKDFPLDANLIISKSMPSITRKLKKEGVMLKSEIKQRTASYVAGAFGVIAGLAWNDFAQSLIKALLPNSNNTLLAKFIYAAFITLAVVVFTSYIMRFSQDNNSENEKEKEKKK